MKKMILVNNCYDCHKSHRDLQGLLFCGLLLRNIEDETKISSWCPLPNAPLSAPSSRPDKAYRCPKCGSDIGHFPNCPDGICFISGS